MSDARHTPLEWRLLGYRAGVDWCARDGLYRASIAELPGCFARGATRRDALRRLAAAIERHLLVEPQSPAAPN